jgi:tetratricopeptide (TPR) repeat protein
MGNYFGALNKCEAALNKDPNDKYALYYKGESLYNLKNYVDAMECYDQAIDRDNGIKAFWAGKINCLKKLIEMNASYELRKQLDNANRSAEKAFNIALPGSVNC